MAAINITAIYKTEAAPIDLVSNQLGATSAVRNNYKQKNSVLKTTQI
jgi:hypothetical protein